MALGTIKEQHAAEMSSGLQGRCRCLAGQAQPHKFDANVVLLRELAAAPKACAPSETEASTPHDLTAVALAASHAPAPLPRRQGRKPTRRGRGGGRGAPARVVVASSAAAVPSGRSPRAPEALLAAVLDAPFDPGMFHRELSATLQTLSLDRNVAAAVHRIRAQCVPRWRQAPEFADILTRASEESRGPARRSAFAFAAGLAAAETSAFAKEACVEGLRVFFAEVYEELRTEVPRLSTIVTTEMVPTLRSVLPAAALSKAVPSSLAPAELRAAQKHPAN